MRTFEPNRGCLLFIPQCEKFMKWKVGNLDDFNWSGSRLKEMKNKKDHPLKRTVTYLST